MRRYEGKSDIFFGIERRLRKEEMEEQFNREAKEGWIFAADAARITYERAGSKDRKHTSGGVFVAVDSNLGTAIPGNEGRITRAWVDVQASFFSVLLAPRRLDSEERSPAGGSVKASQSYQTSVAVGM